MVRLETETFINASPDAVWQVLTDFQRYPEWNPLIPKAVGEAKPGGRMRMTAFAPDGSGKSFTFTGTLVRFEPGRVLEWTGGVPLILSGLHYFHLSPASGGTRMVHGEDFFGLYPFFAGRKRMQGLRPAYEGLNRAIVERVAKLRGHGAP
ncbi:SRPBCC family protein [Pyxidicoccus sp. 3LG]